VSGFTATSHYTGCKMTNELELEYFCNGNVSYYREAPIPSLNESMKYVIMDMIVYNMQDK
jgi:hypothetical protein